MLYVISFFVFCTYSYASVFDAVDQTLELWKKKNPFENKPIPDFNAHHKGACSKNIEIDAIQERENTIRILVSFSMPGSLLQSLFKDAQKHNGILVMQGLLENSFEKTSKRLQKLGITLSIDPNIFKAYGVLSVPTFICKKGNKILKLSGNVPLSHVVKRFSVT